MRPITPPISEAEQANRKETFKSITACTSEEAAQYLEACTWNLNAAVDLFLNNTSEGAKRNEPNNNRLSNGAGTSSHVEEVTISDDDLGEEVANESLLNGNRGLARGLAKSVAEVVPMEDGDVRAPMAFRSGPIVQSFAQQYGNGIQTRGGVLGGAFEGIRDLRALAEQQNPRSEALPRTTDTTRSLQSLFRLPIDITHAGDWESAKAASIERACWVLVNVQDTKEFASQTLNRDVWSNDGVKELIRSNFVFWQVYLDSVDGQRMRNYYGVHCCPAVFIVDPRTGEKVVDVPLKCQDAMTICDKLTRFMDDFPDFAARDRSLVDQTATGDAEPSHRDSQNMEEVITEPTIVSNEPKRKRKTDDSGEMIGKRSRTTDGDIDRQLETSTRGLTMCDEDEWKRHVVPGGNPIKVMLRFPDGSRHEVELTGATRLFALYQYIRGHGLSPEDHLFVLSFPKREYSTDRSEESLTQLGFSRSEMIHVETKE